MKWKAINYLVIIAALISCGFYLIQNSPSEMQQKLNTIFNSDKITITIEHHGGYTASDLGKSILQISKLKNDTLYNIRYKDAIDKKKLDYNITPSSLNELKILFTKLIEYHDANKKLSGDCLTIDKNYILKTSNQTLIIKPKKDSSNSYCIINWIYQSEF